MRRESVALGIIVSGCYCLVGCSPDEAATSRPVAIRLGNSKGAFSSRLAAEYKRVSPKLDVQLLNFESTSNIDAVVRGDADIAISTADVVYSVYRNSLQTLSSSPAPLRAIARLHVLPHHLLIRGDSDIRQVAELRSGARGVLSHTVVHRLILSAVGMDTNAIERNFRPGLFAVPEASKLVGDGMVDAALIGDVYPSDIVRDALRRGARLVPIEGREIERLQREYRFFRHIAIPANVYPGYPRPIPTIGVDTLFVCRSDLDETLSYELTRGLFNALPALTPNIPGLRVFDIAQAPATPIPLHEGAARYYREMELLH